MTGIICIDKPQDFTSFDVVAKARGITRCRKMGHGGTLDPMATGVLPLFFGRAAKAMDIMPVQDKRYTAAFRLGLCTDTQDITGTVLSQDDRAISEQQLTTALAPLRGIISQLPPMYSAVQVGGQRLYDLARRGIEVERPAREVTIHQLVLLDYNPRERTGTLDVRCSKGTYIRTLIHDLGQALGCGGTLTALRRTETMGFGLADCVTFPELQELADTGRLAERLLPVDRSFAPMVRVQLSPRQMAMFQNGVRLDMNRIPYKGVENYVAVWCKELFIGTAYIDRELAELRLDRLFYLERGDHGLEDNQ